jgi:antitoxin VapB
METAKIFKSGGSQAVRLPKSCRFDCDEVSVKKIGSIVMLYSKDDALKNFLDSEPFTTDVYENILESRHMEYQSPREEMP